MNRVPARHAGAGKIEAGKLASRVPDPGERREVQRRGLEREVRVILVERNAEREAQSGVVAGGNGAGNPVIDLGRAIHAAAGCVLEIEQRRIVQLPFPSLADCDAMIAAARESGVQLGVISQRRFYEPVRRLKAAIEAGKIGAPVLGTVLMLSWRDEAGKAEKAGAKERKRDSPGRPLRFLHVNVENGVSRKKFALLGIPGEEVLKERRSQALTDWRQSFVWK